MADSEARASEVQYDVFLSFSGKDTRCHFTGFLNNHLKNAGIRVFMDDDEIRVGDEIHNTILQAITRSKIYIPIISQTYFDRKWCLMELTNMVHEVCWPEGRKRIFPIFYKVKPGNVKEWTPRPNNPSSEAELQAFKKALVDVGQIKGWKVEEGQSQPKIVDLVVQKVLEELGKKDESQMEHPIELDDLTQLFEDLFNRGTMVVQAQRRIRSSRLSGMVPQNEWEGGGEAAEEGGAVEAAGVAAAAEGRGAGAMEAAAGIAAGKRKRGCTSLMHCVLTLLCLGRWK